MANDVIATDEIQNLSVRMYDATCRIEGAWLVPMPSAPDALMEAFEYCEKLPEGLQPFVATWSEDEQDELFTGTDGRNAWEALFESMYERQNAGFVVQSSVPVFENCGTGASYSWGHYRTKAYFAPSIEAAIAQACEDAEAAYASAARQEPAS